MNNTIPNGQELNIDSNDYRDVPHYRDHVREFIDEEHGKGPVFVRVDGNKRVQVRTIEDVDKVVENTIM